MCEWILGSQGREAGEVEGGEGMPRGRVALLGLWRRAVCFSSPASEAAHTPYYLKNLEEAVFFLLVLFCCCFCFFQK